MPFEDDKSAHPVYREHDLLSDFIMSCYVKKRISREEMNAVFQEFVDLTDNAGINKLELDDASIAVLRHTNHAMRRKLLELHPELADEVRGMDSGPIR
jgi:hypothetical protein